MTQFQILTLEGKWMLVGQTASGLESFSGLDECERDNIYEFTTDGKYIVTEGASKCNADDLDEKTNTTYSVDGNKIMIGSASIVDQTYAISGNTMTISYSFIFDFVDTYEKIQ